MWNRLGNVAGKVPVDDRDVDFLPVTKALHDAGFHVLLFDLRLHGESGKSRHLVTFGPIEARDFIGAVNYLRSRADVDGQRIGALGISMGGSIALHGAPDCQPIKALLAYQPSTVPVFNANFCTDQFGKLGTPLPAGVELIYRLWRSPPPSSQYPGNPATQARRHDRPLRPGHRRQVGDDGRRRVDARGHAAHRRPGRAVPLDRALRRLPLRVREARGDRRVLQPPRVGDGICERSRASKATSGMTLRAVMKTPADGATR